MIMIFIINGYKHNVTALYHKRTNWVWPMLASSPKIEIQKFINILINNLQYGLYLVLFATFGVRNALLPIPKFKPLNKYFVTYFNLPRNHLQNIDKIVVFYSQNWLLWCLKHMLFWCKVIKISDSIIRLQKNLVKE